MAGIYIHIPFCKKACHYCNFHFSTSLKLQNDFLAALLKEIALRRDYLDGEEVNTVYFGGGTPSLMDERSLGSILEALHQHYNISSAAEITLEANPDDINASGIDAWINLGINRLSIGVQSFFEKDLQWMNRAHNKAQAIESIRMAQEKGIGNISIDLIYGVPGLTDENWKYNLSIAVSMGIPHLSCYALTVEPDTALHHLISKKRSEPVNPDDQARQFLIMSNFLQEKGYEHYEISNFSLPGKRSRHNSAYWSGAKYLGLGPSAHSFNGVSRQWNISNNPLYIQSLARNELQTEIEMLTEIQKVNEYLMTSLRTMEGADISYLERSFGTKYTDHLSIVIADLLKKGWIENIPGRIILTREGKLFADGIAADLFVTE